MYMFFHPPDYLSKIKNIVRPSSLDIKFSFILNLNRHL